jgi:hypothetical protein
VVFFGDPTSFGLAIANRTEGERRGALLAACAPVPAADVCLQPAGLAARHRWRRPRPDISAVSRCCFPVPTLPLPLGWPKQSACWLNYRPGAHRNARTHACTAAALGSFACATGSACVFVQSRLQSYACGRQKSPTVTYARSSPSSSYLRSFNT